MKKILVLEDEASIRSFIVINLRRAGYDVIEAESGEEALERLRANPDVKVALLDIMLPGIDGFEVCRRIRATNTKIGIIMLTARSQEMDKVTGLMTGADDYVTKPFGMGELMARMRVCLRRAGNKEGEPILTCGGLQLNLLEHRVVVEGREVKLTPTEYELLKVMLKYAGRVLTHKQLLKAVWGNEYDTDTHYIRIYMRQLRRKIEPDPAQPKYLITEAGIGYRLLGGE